MKPKIIEIEGKTFIEAQDGKPVYTHDDGKDSPFDVPDMYSKLTKDGRRNAELQKSLETYESRLKAYEGIEDPEAARKALETVANVKAGELIQAGQVEEIKLQARKAAEEQVTAAQKEYTKSLKLAEAERNKFRDELYGERVATAFSRSKFITEKASIPPDLMQAKFGSSFKIEDGRMVGYHQTGEEAGKPIYSRVRGGELADFEEAIERLSDDYAYRDNILKGTGSTGSGARQNGNGGDGSGTITRKTFDALTPLQQMESVRKGVKIV